MSVRPAGSFAGIPAGPSLLMPCLAALFLLFGQIPLWRNLKARLLPAGNEGTE